MNIITGATGLVGSYLCRFLVKKGEKVVGLKRKTSQFDLIGDAVDKIEWIEGDLLDIDFLLKATENCQFLFHCGALVSYKKKFHKQLMQVNVTGTKNVVNAALQNNVKKLVHVSSIAALGASNKHQLITENINTDKWNSAYGLSKYLAELEIFRGIAEGMESVIINPSVILGAGYWHKNSGNLFKNADNNFAYYSSGNTGYVDVRDVVNIMYQLMHKNISNERFIVSAENISFKNILTKVAVLLNKKPPTILAGDFLQAAALVAAYLKSFVSKKERFLTRELIKTANSTQLYNNTKIKKTLDYNFIPIEKSLGEIADSYKQSKSKNTSFGLLQLVNL